MLGQFVLRRDMPGQLNQFMIKERYARLQPPGHGLTVDPFDRIIDQHHIGIEAQSLVDRVIGAGLRKMGAHEFKTGIKIGQVVGRQVLTDLSMTAIKERAGVCGNRIGSAGHWRIPVVTTEDFIGALPRLYNLDVLGNLTREQEEPDIVVRHHGLGHGPDGMRQIGHHLVGANHQLVMIGVVMLGDQV